MNNYGIPDPGLQNPGDFGNAATNVYSPQSPAAQGNGKYEDVAGKGWRVKLPNGGYRVLKEHEYRGLGITPASEEMRIRDIQSKADREEIKRDQERKQGILDERHDDNHSLQLQEQKTRLLQVEGELQRGKDAQAVLMEQLRQSGITAGNAHTIQQGQLNEAINTRIDNAQARDRDFALRTTQVERSNNLLDAKLRQEGQQFERQHALDEKNGRRTQVMGALTLIAQSAAKL